MQRQRVLELYASLLRLSRRWIASKEASTPKERAYIERETRQQFRANKNVSRLFCSFFYFECFLAQISERSAKAN